MLLLLIYIVILSKFIVTLSINLSLKLGISTGWELLLKLLTNKLRFSLFTNRLRKMERIVGRNIDRSFVF